MRQQIEQRRRFHTAFSCYASTEPTADIPGEVVKFHANLLREEVGELESAAADGNLTGVLDALADTLYALLGAALAFGVENVFEQAFTEVHLSNMSKLGADGKPVARESDGKFLKGPNYFRPRLSELVQPR